VGGWLVTPWSNSSIFDKYQKAKNPAGDKERYQKLFFTNSPRKNLVFNTANLSLKKEAFFEIGGINEVFRTPGFEDFDLGLRILEKGFTVAYMPYPVIHLKCLNLKSCIALAKNRYHNYVLFLREKEKFPENCLQNHTLSGLVVRFADIFISPSYNRIAEFIEYATRLQVAIQKNINMENFFRKSYKIDADSKK
jgi:GT2 family glycosyltransferase